MQVENHNEVNDQNQDNQSSLTLTVSLSAGDNSTNIAPNQHQVNNEVDQLEHMNFFEPEEVFPVVVHGEQPAMNINNFQNLGIGVQNIMLAYQGQSDNEEEAPVDEAAQDHEMLENQIADNVSDPSLEAFQFNDFASPEVAHLQIARVETHFFLEEETQKFSKEGMEL
jgi:hypothetical protein